MTIFRLNHLMNTATKGLLDKIILFLATGFGSGYAPKMPGTVGSLVAILPLLWFQTLPLWVFGAIIILASLIGILLCQKADLILKTHDNKAIVWDEFCGLWLTMFAAPQGWLTLVFGFICFRFFDIVKPWPISWADKKVSGGLGVMLDDLIAGIMAMVCVQVVTYFGILV